MLPKEVVRPDLVAVVATAAVGAGTAVAPGHAAPVLRDALAGFPVAQEPAVGRVLDGFKLVAFQALGDSLGRLVVAAIAERLQPVLVQPVHAGDAFGVEIALHHGGGLGAIVPRLRRECDGERRRAEYRCLEFFHGFVPR